MAAFDYFLRVDGVPGESADAKHKGEIEVLSWSWGETNETGPRGPGGGAGAGRVDMSDLTVVARVSKASPHLLLACASGKHFKSAVLTGRKAGKGQADYLTFSLSDVLVSSYQTGGSASDEPPMDSVALSFGRIQVEYKEQKADGSLGETVKVGWDRKANKQI
jgi:type VI secretion system secreted protein Hcp